MLPDTEAIRAKITRLQDLEQRVQETKLRHVQAAAQSYPKFAEYVLRDQKTDQPIVMAELHRTWFQHIDECWSRGLFCAILAPYGSGKSTNLAIGLPLFALGNDPSLRIKLVSASDKPALERVVVVRQYIEASEELHAVFPNLRPHPMLEWSKHALYVDRPTRAVDASLEGLSATASAIGGRAELLVLDDVNDMRNTIHFPRLREQIFQNITGVFFNRLEPGACVVAIMTRYHEFDLVGKILRDPVMRQRWGFLIQRVSDDFSHIECEVIMGTGDDSTREAIDSGKYNRLRKLFALYDGGLLAA